MNILYLSDSTIPSTTANSIHVMEMCQALSKHGHNVTLIAKLGKNEKGMKNDYEFYGVKENFKIIKYKAWKIRFLLIIPEIIKPFLLLRKNKNIDLYYSRSIIKSYLASFFKKPIIMEFHNIPLISMEKIILKKLFRKKKFTRLIFISKALYNEYKKNFFKIDCETIISSDGANAIEYVSEKKSIHKNKKIEVGYSGHLYPGRGIEIILLLAKKFKDFNFNIIGGNEQDLIIWKKKSIEKNVIFHGHIPHEKVPDSLLSFDILLAPYQKKVSVSSIKGDTSNWMSPLKLFEYMAAGKPIICSDLPVLREVMINDVNCLLVKPDDIDEWSEALKRLSGDLELRARLGNNARKIFQNEYTWDKRVERILKNIEKEIIASKEK